jgi:tetrahydromethanopterin S-methyltransferase subunit H
VLEKIKEVGLKSGIALTYSSKALFSYRERIRLLETLIPKMEKVGIKNILIDTAVLDIPTLGLACRAIQEIKHNFGYPVGCGAHNAIESWGALKKINDKILTWCSAAIVNGYPVAIGADLLFYGPLSAAKYIFPVIGLINAANGQIRMEDGKRPNANHPRFMIPRFQ